MVAKAEIARFGQAVTSKRAMAAAAVRAALHQQPPLVAVEPVYQV
jgi:hypothetical protein